MRPVLFAIGSFQLSSFGVFAALAFLVGAFVLWRCGRDARLAEERVLNSLFITAVYVIIGSRVVYMITHFDVFSPSLLRFFLLWKFPGFSLIGALVFGIVGIVLSSKRENLRTWQLLDIYALAALPFIAVVSIGGLLDGAEVGIPTTFAWAVAFGGFTQLRHPLGAYEAIAAILGAAGLFQLHARLERQKQPLGITGLVGILAISAALFLLAFIKEDSLYWGKLSATQIFLLILALGASGGIYLRLHGHLVYRIQKYIRTVYP